MRKDNVIFILIYSCTHSLTWRYIRNTLILFYCLTVVVTKFLMFPCKLILHVIFINVIIISSEFPFKFFPAGVALQETTILSLHSIPIFPLFAHPLYFPLLYKHYSLIKERLVPPKHVTTHILLNHHVCLYFRIDLDAGMCSTWLRLLLVGTAWAFHLSSAELHLYNTDASWFLSAISAVLHWTIFSLLLWVNFNHFLKTFFKKLIHLKGGALCFIICFSEQGLSNILLEEL